MKKNTWIILFVLLAFFAGLYVYSTQRLDTFFVVGPTKQYPSARFIRSVYENLQNKTERSAKCPNILVQSGDVLLLYNTTDTHDEMPVIFNSLDEYMNHVRVQRQNGVRCPVLFLDQTKTIGGMDEFRIRSTPFNDYYETFEGKPQSTANPPVVAASQLSTNLGAVSMPFFNIEAFDGGMGSPSPFGVSPSPAPAPAPTVVAQLPPVPAPQLPPTENVMRSSSNNRDVGYSGSGGSGGDRQDYMPMETDGLWIGKYKKIDALHDLPGKQPNGADPTHDNWSGSTYTQQQVESGFYQANTVTSPVYSQPKGVQFYPGLHNTYPDPPNFTDNKMGIPTPPYLQ